MIAAVQFAAVVVLVLAATALGACLGIVIGRRTRGGAVDAPIRPVVAVSSAPVAQGEGAEADSTLGLRRAVDQLKIGVVMCDASLVITYRNEVANALSGTHSGVIVDHHLDQLFEAVRGDTVSSRTVELHGPPKRTMKIEVVATSDGGAVATVEDITEQVRIDSMRTDFVANISHELKTPVGAIAVLAEMLADESDPDVVVTLSERVVDESHRAARTIDDLLELSRIETSHGLDDVVDLTDVIGEAVARGRMVAEGSDVTIHAIDLAEPVFVIGDRPQLTSAVGNLVENAVKYSESGGHVHVSVRVGVRWVEVTVVDQGLGIPARDLDRVFERFYRVDKGRGRSTGGTGLGLAIVRHVMGNHGGDVSVTSQEGEGSTFVLRLPARLIVERPRSDDSSAVVDATPDAVSEKGPAT